MGKMMSGINCPKCFRPASAFRKEHTSSFSGVCINPDCGVTQFLAMVAGDNAESREAEMEASRKAFGGIEEAHKLSTEFMDKVRNGTDVGTALADTINAVFESAKAERGGDGEDEGSSRS